MTGRRSAGSIFWGLTLIVIGGLFLARNLGYSIPIWSGLARYWPVLIIIWGLIKLVDFYRNRRAGNDRPLFSGGEVALLIFVILMGSAFTTAANISPELGGFFEFGDIDFWDITGNNYEYTESHQLPAVRPDSTIEILNLYGNVDVQPADTDQITLEVQKIVRAPNKEEADRLAPDFSFAIRDIGTGYRIVSSKDENVTGDGRFGRERQRFKSSMTIRVPKRSVLRLDNRNGRVNVAGLTGNQTIVNRYGQVSVRGITGALQLENRNGGVDVGDISESAKITNRYADVTATNIGGSLELENRNGSVEVTTVKGPATIINSYSSVEVRDVTGRLELQNRNGRVVVEDVTDSAKITNSYSSTSAKNIGGALEVSNRNGSVNVSDVKGNTTITNSYAPITVSNIEGELKVDGRNNGVDVEHVTGDVEVESSYQNISVRDPRAGVTVRNRNGDVHIVFPQAPTRDVTVNAEYSDVTIEMPPGSSFAIDGRTRYGRVESDFDVTLSGGVRESENTERTISGRSGTGGPTIRIDTRNGDIRLDRRG